MDIESLLTIFGGVIALRVLYKMDYINVITSKCKIRANDHISVLWRGLVVLIGPVLS